MNYKTRVCKFCGKEFVPTSGRQLYCPGPHHRICPICGKTYIEDNSANLNNEPVACSYECRAKLVRATSLNKYGVTAPGNYQSARDKAKRTMLGKYGVEFPMQSDKVKNRAAATRMEKHTAPAKVVSYRNTEVHNVRTGMSVKEWENVHNSIVDGVCYRLSSMRIQYERKAVIAGLEYDLRIPHLNTLIDVDTTFTHSVCNHIDSRYQVSPYYHLEMAESAAKAGYRLIHIFDWDDIDMVIDMLAPRKSLYARNMRVYKLNNRSASNFLNDFHIQGSCRGQLLCLGLVQDDTLYQVMTFGRSRYDKHYDVELLRFCNRKGYSVVGGASRLFRYAMDKFELYSIVSYCDRAKFTGGVYEKIGMKKIRTTPPQEVWSREGKKITANLLRSKGYDALFGTNYGKGTSNDKLMIEHGWLPVYDCGQIVFATN